MASFQPIIKQDNATCNCQGLLTNQYIEIFNLASLVVIVIFIILRIYAYTLKKKNKPKPKPVKEEVIQDEFDDVADPTDIPKEPIRPRRVSFRGFDF
jgi:flagellar biosynthesis/type III secretory pathway M-ring protein FliF/YscJ